MIEKGKIDWKGKKRSKKIGKRGKNWKGIKSLGKGKRILKHERTKTLRKDKNGWRRKKVERKNIKSKKRLEKGIRVEKDGKRKKRWKKEKKIRREKTEKGKSSQKGWKGEILKGLK